MSFQNKKRKGVKLQPPENENEIVLKLTEIDPNKMEINFNDDIARFRRLRFKGCPKTIICSVTKAILDDINWVK